MAKQRPRRQPTFSIQLPPPVLAQVNGLAGRLGMSRSWVIRECVLLGLSDPQRIAERINMTLAPKERSA